MTKSSEKTPTALSDPFLHIHRLPHGEYSIAGKYNPASIKDQMVRAVALIDRAVFHGVLDHEKDLLIVGAGAAGASAAFRACDHHINTTLVEKNPTPFERQRYSSRVIDPTEFDWPAPHWRDAQMADLPLDFSRGPASAIAAKWQETYDLRESNDPYLTVLKNVEFVQSIRANSGKQIALLIDYMSKDQDHVWSEFDFVLNCTGPGQEQASLGEDSKFASYLFWEDDLLAAPNFGLPLARPLPSILISGGGDGALQDFLRIAFPGKTAARHLRPSVSGSRHGAPARRDRT